MVTFRCYLGAGRTVNFAGPWLHTCSVKGSQKAPSMVWILMLLGSRVGEIEGSFVGVLVGLSDGEFVGAHVGSAVGSKEGEALGCLVGVLVG